MALEAENAYTQESSTNTSNQGIRGEVKLSPEQLEEYYQGLNNREEDNQNTVSYDKGSHEYYK